MKRMQYKILIECLAIVIFFPLVLNAQSNEITLQKLVTLRDSFINQIKAFGFNPSLPPPKIVLDNPRSFGNYDSIENILHTTDWKTLPPESKDLFEALASQTGNEKAPEDVFEIGTHEWIFIHELAHWWRACQHQSALPYDEEMAANRIAIAFWREKDTALMNFQVKVFKGFIAIFQALFRPDNPDETSSITTINNYLAELLDTQIISVFCKVIGGHSFADS